MSGLVVGFRAPRAALVRWVSIGRSRLSRLSSPGVRDGQVPASTLPELSDHLDLVKSAVAAADSALEVARAYGQTVYQLQVTVEQLHRELEIERAFANAGWTG